MVYGPRLRRLEAGIEARTAMLVGTNRQVIADEVSRLLTDSEAYSQMAQAVNPYW